MNARETYIEMPSPIEKELLQLFKKKPPEVIFDIGSCEGEDSIKYSKLFPAAKIVAFEPLPDNQQLIRENFKKYSIKNVEIIPIALSDTKGICDFYVSSGSPEGTSNTMDWNYGNKSSSILKPDKHLMIAPWIKFNNAISVPTNTLQTISKELNISCIDFAHIDVQGAELKVLSGAGQLLTNIKVIWLEVSDITLYQNQPRRIEIEKFMKDSGFCLYINAIDGTSGDQMYINHRYFKRMCLLLNLSRMFDFVH